MRNEEQGVMGEMILNAYPPEDAPPLISDTCHSSPPVPGHLMTGRRIPYIRSAQLRDMNLTPMRAGNGIISILILCCFVASASPYPGDLTVSGPGTEIQVSGDEIDRLTSEYGLQVQVDGEQYTAIPLWRVVRLADPEKEYGPEDIITVSGETSLTIPFQAAYQSNGYLIAEIGDGLSLVLDSEGDTILKGRIDSVEVSETDDWELILSSGDITQTITRDAWDAMITQYQTEKSGAEDRLFSGVPIFRIFESQGILPGEGARLKITGQDGYSTEIPWDEIAGDGEYLLADRMNHEIMPEFIVLSDETGNTPAWPLMVIDPDFPGINSVGNVVEMTIIT